VSSPPFPIPGAASHLADVTTLPRRVTLPFYGIKISLLLLLHLLSTLRPVTSPFELKSKHWIRTPATSYPPWTAWLPPSTAIKRSPQPWSLSPPLNCVSILSPPWPEHHTIEASLVVVVPFHHHPTHMIPPYNETHDDELTDPLSLFEQFIDIWIHVKR
jgi:hypothetical protein